jgi:hypothetical protein
MPFVITATNSSLASKTVRDTQVQALEMARSFAGRGMLVRVTDEQGRDYSIHDFQVQRRQASSDRCV